MSPKNLKDINNYITNLFEYISSKVSNSLVKIILSHYQLEAIHPFFDGNGRVGRVLMSLQLVMERKLQYPILFISGYILQNKSTYYELFREIQEKGNWNDWIIFHLNGISNQASEVILRVKEINILHKKFVIEIDKLLKISKMKLESIENYFFIQAFYTQTNMAKVLKISRNTSKKYLEILEENNVLESRKVGREKLYFIPEFVEILS